MRCGKRRWEIRVSEPGAHHSPGVLPCNPLPGVKHLVCSNARATTAPLSMLVIESTWGKQKGQVGAPTWYSFPLSRDRKYVEGSKNCWTNITDTCFSRSLCNTHTLTHTQSHGAPVNTVCYAVCKQSWGNCSTIKQMTGSSPKVQRQQSIAFSAFPLPMETSS